MFTYSLWISFLLILWIYILWHRRRFYKLMLEIPGSMGYPVIGIAYRFINKFPVLYLLKEEYEKHGPNVLIWFTIHPILVTNDPDTIQEVLTSPHTINKAEFVYRVLKQVVGNGLILVKDSLWLKHRKAINPLFSQSSLLNFFSIFNKESNLFIEELGELVDNRDHCLTLRLKRYALGISSQTVWGSDVKSEEQYKNFTLTKMFDSVIEAGLQMAISPWLNNKIMRKVSGIEKVLMDENAVIRNKVKECIDKQLNIATESVKSNGHGSFMDLAIDQMKLNIFSFQDVVDEAQTFIIGAFETTALSITYILMYLGIHPEYQEKVFEELISVFPNRGNFEVSYEDMEKLVYLDLVLKETLRLTPAIPMMGREVSQDFKLSNGLYLPKGLQILISPYVLHRRKDVWGPDADKFNPDNCLPQNLEGKHHYAYIPFSKGKRNCIGLKYATYLLKITIVKLLRNYKFSTNFGYEDMEVETSMAFTLKTMPKFIIAYRE